MQLLTIESACTAAETALLADVKAKNADAAATELLRLFQVRCVADGLSSCARRMCRAVCCVCRWERAKWDWAKWDWAKCDQG